MVELYTSHLKDAEAHVHCTSEIELRGLEPLLKESLSSFLVQFRLKTLFRHALFPAGSNGAKLQVHVQSKVLFSLRSGAKFK